MARLNLQVKDDSDEELPDLATLLRQAGGAYTQSARKTAMESATVAISLVKASENRTNNATSKQSTSRNTIGTTSNELQARKQRPLGPLKLPHVNSLLLPRSKSSLSYARRSNRDQDDSDEQSLVRSSPKRAAKIPVDYSRLATEQAEGRCSASQSDESFTDLTGFIMPDSASDGGDRPTNPKRKEGFHISPRKPCAADETSRMHISSATIDIISPEEKPSVIPCPQSPLSTEPQKETRFMSSEFCDSDGLFSNLRFSPPRSKTPYRLKKSENQITPPSSPPKSKTGSPSKTRRIPPSPHRPSIDAFWSQDLVNDWNDEYSLKRPPRTPRRTRLLTVVEDEDTTSPTASPQKSPTKSPTKQAKQAIKAFNSTKNDLATVFLAELDETITNSQVLSLSASTGGIQILWSKKLSSTAGRANWRREAVRTTSPCGTVSETTFRHHASIELAEKVIDSEDRLINVLAHEYCHLANFMISGVKDNPHGKDFKVWAARATTAFGNRGVEVTTKHDYDISYKYIWTCGKEGGCGLEYKRHSKSIDPSKHSCGACKGRLVQIVPVPRKESEYQKFVKANWDRVKAGAPEDAGMGQVMGLLAKEFREVREGKGKGKGEWKEREIEETTIVKVDEEREESPELDIVVRKLDFLNLGS